MVSSQNLIGLLRAMDYLLQSQGKYAYNNNENAPAGITCQLNTLLPWPEGLVLRDEGCGRGPSHGSDEGIAAHRNKLQPRPETMLWVEGLA